MDANVQPGGDTHSTMEMYRDFVRTWAPRARRHSRDFGDDLLALMALVRLSEQDRLVAIIGRLDGGANVADIRDGVRTLVRGNRPEALEEQRDATSGSRPNDD